jgi:hypothetical protein
MKTTHAKLEDIYREDPERACRIALRLTRSLHENVRLEAIDKLLGTFGTEAIRGEWQNGYWCDIVAAYCNTGDSYGTTVVQVRGETIFDSSTFIITSWGDWVEQNGEA